jgi:hypothetical protein
MMPSIHHRFLVPKEMPATLVSIGIEEARRILHLHLMKTP